MRKTSKSFKRIISLFLTVVMLASIGTSVMAEDSKIQKRATPAGYEHLMGWGYFFDDTSKNVVSSRFGEYRIDANGKGKYHAGIDVIGGNIYGTPIKSVDSGTVAEVYLMTNGWDSVGYAASVRMNGYLPFSSQPMHTMYMHMSNVPSVSKGSSVSKGTVLGYVGSTGDSSGPHLHFQVNMNGQAYADYWDCIDPVLFFPSILPQSRSAYISKNDLAATENESDNILIPLEI